MSTTKTRESIEEREERELYASCALSPCEFFFDFNKLPLVTEPTLTEIRNRWLSASQGDWCWDVEFEVGAPYIGKAPRLASWLRDGRIITRVLLTLFKGDGERDIVLHLHDPHGITDADVALLGFAHTDIGRLLGVIHRQRKLL